MDKKEPLDILRQVYYWVLRRIVKKQFYEIIEHYFTDKKDYWRLLDRIRDTMVTETVVDNIIKEGYVIEDDDAFRFDENEIIKLIKEISDDEDDDDDEYNNSASSE
jgi:hypothetical protein